MSRRTKRQRKHVPLAERLASALADRLPMERRDELRAAKVTAAAVIRLFTPDHNHLHALGGSDKWWNLTMSLRGPALKTKDNRDTSIVAKSDRLTEAQQEFQRRILAKPCGQKRERTGTIPGRRFNGTPIPSRWRA